MKPEAIPAESYPLAWPLGYPRTRHPKRSPFTSTRKRTAGSIRNELLAELRRMRCRDVIISTNIRVRQDGVLYAKFAEPDDSGVAVYFVLRGSQHVIACDAWRKVADNLRAISKSIDALRGLDRWGCTDIVERAFTGFQALPAPGEGTGSAWWDILGTDPRATEDQVVAAYRKRVKEVHPDTRHGSEAAFRVVQVAYEQALATFAT